MRVIETFSGADQPGSSLSLPEFPATADTGWFRPVRVPETFSGADQPDWGPVELVYPPLELRVELCRAISMHIKLKETRARQYARVTRFQDDSRQVTSATEPWGEIRAEA
jgi:hypothetical protein